MLEVSKMLKNELKVEDSVIAKKYWPTQTAALGADVPKLIAAVGDEETMKALLGTFDNLYLPTPESGSLFAIDYYQHKVYPQYVYVEVSYCPDGTDIDATCTLLKYDSYNQDYRGWNKSTSFEHYVENRLSDYEKDASLGSSPSAATVCAAAFTATAEYQDTDRFYKDLLKRNGFETETVTPVPDNNHSHNGFDWHDHSGGWDPHNHNRRQSPWCRWPWWDC